MPSYNDLRPQSDYQKQDYAQVFPLMTDTERKRTLRNLLDLREGLFDDVSPRKTDQNLLVASWNLKEFGHTTQRLPEAFFYIAEIVSRFDLVAIQEIKSSLDHLEILMRLLGEDWAYLVNDITEGKDGNSERSAYLYNKKRVQFGGLAGEIVLWDDLTKGSPVKQLKRTPYITGFRAGWKTFAMICLHLHPGDDADDVTRRAAEVELLLEAIEAKTEGRRFWNQNLILCGDFNFYSGASKDDPTLVELAEAGYREVEGLKGKPTTAAETQVYDRLFIMANDYFRVGENANGQENGEVFHPFQYVYRDGSHTSYVKHLKEDYTGSKDMDDPAVQKTYFERTWRRNQLSDHNPIWFELMIDSADDFLRTKLEEL